MRQSASFTVPESSFDYHQVICTLASLPSVEESLQTCSPSNIVQLHCSRILSPVKLFTGLKKFLEALEPRRKYIFIRLDSSIYSRSCLDEGRLYASLCHQILTQQPQLFFHIRHLHSNLEDAVRSSDTTWRARAMWNCLCVLLRYPRDVPLYCFIEDDSLPATKSFIARFTAAMIKTEIRLGVVATVADPSNPLFPEHTTLELTTEHFAPSLKSDISMWIKNLIESNEIRISDDMRQVLLDNLAEVGTYDLLDDAMAFFLQQQSLLTTVWSITMGFRDLTDGEYLSSMIANQVNRHGRWLLVPAVWALYAVRPISQDELDEILSIYDVHTSDDSRNQHQIGPKKFQDFGNILPGVLWVRSGKVGLLNAARRSFELLWDSYFSDFRSPHQLLTKTCLMALLNAFKRFSNNFGRPARYINTSFEKYAAKYWMFHLKQETDIDKKDDTGLEEPLIEDFLRDDENTKAWLAHLQSDRLENRERVDLEDDICCQIIPTTLSRQFRLNVIQAADLSFQLAEMTFRTASDITNSLLLIATETSNLDMTREILLTDSWTCDRVAVCRAIAAAPETICNEIFKEEVSLLESNFDRILLTSIILGHKTAIDFLLQKHQQQMKSSLKSEDDKRLWGVALSENLPTPLQVAIQFSATDVIDKLLQPDAPWWDIEESSTGPEAWNSLHYAAAGGCEEILAKILRHLEFSEPTVRRRMMNAKTSFGNTPLLLAVCQGAYGTSHQLLQYGDHNPNCQINVNISNIQEYTAPMVTARLGYSLLHKTLLHPKDFDYGPQGHSLGRLLKASLCHDHLAAAQITLESYSEFIKQKGNDLGSLKEVEKYPVSGSDTDSTSTFSEHLNEDEDELIGAFNIAVRRNIIQVVDNLLKRLPGILDIIANTSSRDDIPLLLAARSGSRSMLSRLLQAGADASLRNARGKTALHIASYWGYIAAVEVLLKHEANDDKNSCSNDSEEEEDDDSDDIDDDVNYGDYCPTPFQEAVRCDQRHIMDLLLPSAGSRWQAKSMHTACWYGNYDILESLLIKGLDVNTPDYRGSTPIQLASTGNPRCVQLLLLRGAKLELSDSSGFTAVTHAATVGSLEPLKLLIEAGAVLDKSTELGDTPLCMAIENNENECVEALLQGGAPLILSSYYTTKYNNIIDFAMHYSSKTLRVLLQFYKSQENKLEIRNKFHKEIVQALQTAIRNLAPSVLNVLLEFYHVDIDFGEPWTIVHFAAAFGNLPNFQAVLNDQRMQQAIHTSKRWLGTPLQVAALSSREGLEKVEYLLDNQRLAANVVHTGSRFGTVLNAAVFQGDTKMINVILDRFNPGEFSYDCPGGQLGSALHWVVAYWDGSSPDEIAMLNLLHQHGIPGTAKGIQGSDILHCAARFSGRESIEHLLQWPEVLIETVDIQGRLALHLAAMENNWRTLELLTGPGATIRTKDKVGRNCVHFAAGRNSMTVLEAILDDDQNLDLISVPDMDGWLPIHWASRHCDVPMLEYLLQKAQKFHGDSWAQVAEEMKTTDSHRWTPSQVASFHGKDAEATFCKYFQISGNTTGARNSGDQFNSPQEMNAFCDSCHCVSNSSNIS